MPDVAVILDPTAEGTGTELTYASLGDLIEHSAPVATLNPLYASSFDTEGDIPVDLKYGNGEILDKLVVRGASASDLETKLGNLFRKIGKINREGGTYKRTTVTGTVSIYDLLPEVEGGLTWDVAYLVGNAATVDLRYVRKPFWRGTAVDQGTNSELTLPALVFVEAGPGGDVPALGRLIVTDLAAKTQWLTLVGLQSRYYDAAATAALQYEAEAFTPLGLSAKVAGPTGASGAGSNVMRNTDLTPTWTALFKSEIDATNLALTHKGNFRVWARVYRPSTNTGVVSVRLQWGQGDLRRRTLNDPVDFATVWWHDEWFLIDLGMVHLTPPSQGAHRWEFQLLAKSTVTGDQIDVDHVLLFPTTEGYIELAGRPGFANPFNYSARDEFDQTAGVLTGKTLPAGGTWSGVGDTTDFSVESAGKTAERTAMTDTGVGVTGRIALAGATAYASISVQVDFKRSAIADGLSQGLIARYSDTNNLIVVDSLYQSGFGETIRVLKKRLGVFTDLGTYVPPGRNIALNTWYSMRFVVDGDGRWFLWFWLTGVSAPQMVLSGLDAMLAGGGALQTGQVGIWDLHPDVANPSTRNYDNFAAFTPLQSVPADDAAVFASQSLELRHDRAEREDETGAFWQTISERRGSYLKIPPAGQEARSTRMIVKTARGPKIAPKIVWDPVLDDTQAQLFVTPRGLVAPEA